VLAGEIARPSKAVSKSFEQLVDAHYQPLYRFAYSLARNEPDAADLTQETFCRWASHHGELRDASKAKSWLFTTLYREFLNRRRHATRHPEVSLDVSLADGARSVPATHGLDSRAALEELMMLDEHYRAPLSLFYLEQHSYREIAELLDVPIGTVMSRLSRGKSILRERLGRGSDQDAKIIPLPPNSAAQSP
jgi:RNA polymerase sigma factor (sigma-70 family)